MEDKELTERLWDAVPGISANSSSMWLWQLNQGGRIKGEVASVSLTQFGLSCEKP